MVTFSIEWPTVKSDEANKTGTIYLYPLAGGEPIVVNGIHDKSSSLALPQGDYSVIVYNENLSAIQVRNAGSYDQFEAFLEPVARTSGTSTTQVIPPADYLYLLSQNANRVIKVVAGESYNFKLNPAPATQTFRFVVTVKSDVEMAGIAASLSGVASRMNLSQVKALPTDIYPVSVPFTFNTPSRVDNVLALGAVETFGVDPSDRSTGRNTLNLELFPKTADPNLQTKYSVDLTKQFDQFQQNTNLDILIEVGNPNPPGPDPDPDDPVILKITVTVKPWAEEDGGYVDANPL